MDGFERTTNIVVIAATNRPETLDKALLRAGRFDRKVYVGRPTLEERKEIFTYYLSKKKLDKDVVIDSIVKRTSGFVGADIENIVNEAALKTVKDNRSVLSNADFEYALEKLVM
jgi:cell division protease FtsH